MRSPPARAISRAALERRGASFPAELAAATGRPAADVEAALWELLSAGLATCDGFAGLRALLGGGRRGGGGRWSLLRGAEPGPGAAGEPELAERVAQQLLRRYGVVFRDLLAREPGAPPWRELVRVLRRLEARGTVRGGRFAAGRSGEQFALPEAVDALRAVRRAPREGEQVSLSAADPLNLAGLLTPGPRVPAGGARRVVYVDGVPEEPAAAGVGAGASTGR
ncbi:MAG: hypothetical protein QM767_27745 [Anaeromyxobacter sp.]